MSRPIQLLEASSVLKLCPRYTPTDEQPPSAQLPIRPRCRVLASQLPIRRGGPLGKLASSNRAPWRNWPHPVHSPTSLTPSPLGCVSLCRILCLSARLPASVCVWICVTHNRPQCGYYHTGVIFPASLPGFHLSSALPLAGTQGSPASVGPRPWDSGVRLCRHGCSAAAALPMHCALGGRWPSSFQPPPSQMHLCTYALSIPERTDPSLTHACIHRQCNQTHSQASAIGFAVPPRWGPVQIWPGEFPLPEKVS